MTKCRDFLLSSITRVHVTLLSFSFFSYVLRPNNTIGNKDERILPESVGRVVQRNNNKKWSVVMFMLLDDDPLRREFSYKHHKNAPSFYYHILHTPKSLSSLSLSIHAAVRFWKLISVWFLLFGFCVCLVFARTHGAENVTIVHHPVCVCAVRVCVCIYVHIVYISPRPKKKNTKKLYMALWKR